MTGTPWHIEFPIVSSIDDRSHKTECEYFKNTKCLLNQLPYYEKRCLRTSRCPNYREKLCISKRTPILSIPVQRTNIRSDKGNKTCINNYGKKGRGCTVKAHPLCNQEICHDFARKKIGLNGELMLKKS